MGRLWGQEKSLSADPQDVVSGCGPVLQDPCLGDREEGDVNPKGIRWGERHCPDIGKGKVNFARQ